MNSSNPLVSGKNSLSVRSELPHPLFAGDDRECVVELLVDKLEGRFALHSRERPFLLVGRSKECDISLRHPDVSYRHACFQLLGGRVHCVDLLSRSGTYWGTERRQSGWVHPGETVFIGPYRICPAPQTAPSSTAAASPNALIPVGENLLSPQAWERFPACEVELVFLNGRRRYGGSEHWRIDRPLMLVGSGPNCTVGLSHPSVSRVHCSLMATPMGLFITDMLGRGGTFVNGKRVGFQLLQQGDEIGIGMFRFSVNYVVSLGRHGRQSAQPHQPQSPRDTGPPGNEPGGATASAGAGLSQEFVLGLIDRFSSMQQQMFSMSHQQMMFMAQLVGTMHQNHHEVVQQELARIQQINDQIQQLQMQISTRGGFVPEMTSGTSGLSSVGSPAAEHLSRHELEQQMQHLLSQQGYGTPPLPIGGQKREADNPAASSQQQDHPTEEPQTHRTANDDNAPPAASATEKPASQRREADANAIEDQDGNGIETPPPEAETAEAESGRNEDDGFDPATEKKGRQRLAAGDVESHQLLIERMASLEQERTSRWKKIMGLLTGARH